MNLTGIRREVERMKASAPLWGTPSYQAIWIPHEPHPRQGLFLDIEAEEAFYGGAAGGGKSDALLIAALQYVDQPGYAALLLRRTYADLTLPEALMARAREWLEPH